MDAVYIILIAAGIAIMLLALFIKEKTVAPMDPHPANQAEWEKSLQRLGRQIRHEQEQGLAQLRANQSDLHSAIALLGKRMESMEAEWDDMKRRRESVSAHMSEEGLAAEEPIDADMFALHERYPRVFELKQEGLSVDEIAKRLGAGRGEIELIFSLSTRKERGHADA